MMEALDRVLEALEVVERYEDYLFRRAWGRSLIAIGTLFPLGMVIITNADILAYLTGIDANLVRLVAYAMTIVLCWGLVSYTFFGAWRTIKKESDRREGGSLHGILIALVWFASFSLTSLAPEQLTLVSLLWASSLACFLSFVILRLTHSHDRERVILYLAALLGIASILVLAIEDATISGATGLLAFSICFIVAGFIMHRQAAQALRVSR